MGRTDQHPRAAKGKLGRSSQGVKPSLKIFRKPRIRTTSSEKPSFDLSTRGCFIGKDERRAMCVFWLLGGHWGLEGRRRDKLLQARGQPMSKTIKEEAGWPDVQRADVGEEACGETR